MEAKKGGFGVFDGPVLLDAIVGVLGLGAKDPRLPPASRLPAFRKWIVKGSWFQAFRSPRGHLFEVVPRPPAQA